MARIGLLGGSFNPAHRGHRQASLGAHRALGLDAVWWLVSPGNPLKPKAGMAPYAARLASARAMARRAPIRASDFEARVGTRYTVDTLRALRRHYPQHHFIWLVGEDIIGEFHRWKDWRTIARMLPIAVMTRPGYKGGARAARAMGWLRHFVRSADQAQHWTDWKAPAITFLTLAPDPTSATSLRARHPDWHEDYSPAPEATARQRS
ncbi:nicotinate-nucleotide adenylyltransferase [Sphingomicrobium astaxanthinifaciens]|nr:nicotinate-nucleotide adenylyltransferase [Sphingomicrobium astaxanthinifaciens]